MLDLPLTDLKSNDKTTSQSRLFFSSCGHIKAALKKRLAFFLLSCVKKS